MKVLIRTTKKGGKTPLYVKLRIGDSVAWVNLMLPVDIEKWNTVSSSDLNTSNFLDKLGYTRKIQEYCAG